MKQWFEKFKSTPIDELLFYLFVFTIPFQLRTIINSTDAYIDYYFSYHLATFIYLSDIVFIAFLGSYVLFNKEAKNKLWSIIIPILWATINVFHVERWDLWLYSLFKVSQVWLIIGYFALSSHITRSVINIIILSGITQALVGILQFHVQHEVGLGFLGEYMPSIHDSGAASLNTDHGKTLRSYGTLAHPNILGGLLTIALILLLYVSRGTAIIRHWLIVSCGTLVLILGLTTTFSRSAWLASILGAGFIISFTAWKQSLKKAIIMAIIVIVSCGTSFFAYKEVITNRVEGATDSNSAIQYRADFNTNANKAISKFWATGVGAGQYTTWLQTNESLLPWQHQPPHNVLLVYLVEYGLIGLILGVLSYVNLGFTWNNLGLLSLTLILTIFILGALDHYLLTIQTGLLMFAITAGIILTNKKDVSH